MTVYNIPEYLSSYSYLLLGILATGLCSSAGILNARKHNVSETGFVSVFR
jgi:hypothetical protein